jgi:RNA polymerase primary sigma factor
MRKKVDVKKKDINIDLYRLYMKEVTNIPLLTREEELELAQQSQKGDTRAQQKLVEANLRFVVKTAREFQWSGVPVLDLINEGNIGLIEAARRFDPAKNVRFLTYAVWWIKERIHYYLTHQCKMIPLGSKITSILEKVRKVSKKQNAESEQWNLETMSKTIGVSNKELQRALQLSKKIVSLEIPLDGETRHVFGETIPQKLWPSPEQMLTSRERDQYVNELMTHLTDTEAEVLKMRFGIGGDNRMTLREIGEIFGLTRERIRQIQNQSIEKIRPIARKENLVHYLY